MDNEMLVKGFHDLYKLLDEMTNSFSALAEAELKEDGDGKEKAMADLSFMTMIAVLLLVRLMDTYKAVCAALELEKEDSADGQLDR